MAKKAGMFDLSLAMETYGLSVYMHTEYPTMTVASQVLSSISKDLKNKPLAGVVGEVGCSVSASLQMGAFWEYNVYVHFALPPEPSLALMLLGNAFSGFEMSRLELHSPFQKPTVTLKDSSHALSVIRQNQADIRQAVTEGARFSLIKSDKTL